jgi:hypothetical protein
MNDLKLTNDHDLLIEGGDLVLINSEAEVAVQSLKINLLMFRGEWFLDSSLGVPYFQEILGKVTNKTLVDNIIKGISTNSYNIYRVTSLNSTISDDRTYEVNLLEALTEDGEIISVTNLQI